MEAMFSASKEQADLGDALQQEHLVAWLLLDAQSKEGMAKIAADVQIAMTDIDNQDLSPAKKRDAKLNWLKLQRQFLWHCGVAKDATPQNCKAAKPGEEKRVPFTPDEFAVELTPVLVACAEEKLKLAPKKPAALRGPLHEAFRRGKQSPKLEEALKARSASMAELQERTRDQLE